MVEAQTPYAAFFALRDSAAPLEVGDLLESAADGSLRIFKFVGFEEAQWALPEPKPVTAGLRHARPSVALSMTSSRPRYNRVNSRVNSHGWVLRGRIRY